MKTKFPRALSNWTYWHRILHHQKGRQCINYSCCLGLKAFHKIFPKQLKNKKNPPNFKHSEEQIGTFKNCINTGVQEQVKKDIKKVELTIEAHTLLICIPHRSSWKSHFFSTLPTAPMSLNAYKSPVSRNSKQKRHYKLTFIFSHLA